MTFFTNADLMSNVDNAFELVLLCNVRARQLYYGASSESSLLDGMLQSEITKTKKIAVVFDEIKDELIDLDGLREKILEECVQKLNPGVFINDSLDVSLENTLENEQKLVGDTVEEKLDIRPSLKKSKSKSNASELQDSFSDENLDVDD